MKQTNVHNQWWKRLADGKFRRQSVDRSFSDCRTATRTITADQPHVGLLRDPIIDQAEAQETFADHQVSVGADILKGNRLIDTAGDLQNANLARELNPDLAPQDPVLPPAPVSEPWGMGPGQLMGQWDDPYDPSRPDPDFPHMQPPTPDPKPGG